MLVSRLVKESQESPEKLQQKQAEEVIVARKRQVIEDSATALLATNKPILRLQQVQAKVWEDYGLEVTRTLTSNVMRKDMRLGYRLARNVVVQANSERCLVLRQQYALRMLPLLEAVFKDQPVGKRRAINIDESWLNGTRFIRRAWVPSDAPGTFTDKQVQPRISVIVALDTDGRLWFALTQANTDADVMITFLRYLARQLDRETPGWQEDTTILLDNASWHCNAVMRARLARLELPIIYSGPYCYSSAPCEQVFAALKLGDLNPQRLPTGKRSLSNVVGMVETRLAAIPRSVRVRYWHYAVLGLYSYLYFERL